MHIQLRLIVSICKYKITFDFDEDNVPVVTEVEQLEAGEVCEVDARDWVPGEVQLEEAGRKVKVGSDDLEWELLLIDDGCFVCVIAKTEDTTSEAEFFAS